MLPEEIEKSLRSMGDDGAKVRGLLERDFAAYAKQRSRDRAQTRTLLLLTVARPLLSGATKAATKWLFRTDDEGFQARLAQVRERASEGRQGRGDPADGDDDTKGASRP